VNIGNSMTITQLIERLSILKDRFGDLKVLALDSDGDFNPDVDVAISPGYNDVVYIEGKL
jgi:hypothetical protein